MAERDMALPVGHDPNITSTISLCIGRPFRQPLDLTDNDNFCQGLEVWLDDTITARKLFSMFDGNLKYTAAANINLPNIVSLELRSNTQRRLNMINTLMEPIPKKIIYENVDRNITESILVELLVTSYNATKSAASTWHPVLRTIWNERSLKEQLDLANTNGNLNLTIQDFVNSFFTESFQFPVNAGDCFGAASLPTAGEIPPIACTLVNPRKVTIITEEYAENRLNPKYYLWLFLKNNNNTNNRNINFITRTTLSTTNQYDHPLLNDSGLNIDLDIAVLPRTLVQLPDNPDIDVLLFPIGKLSEYHGFELSGNQSAIEWRITNDENLDFEVRIRPEGPTSLTYQGIPRSVGVCGVTSLMDVCPTPSTANNNLVQSIWNDWENAINEICIELQFPSEYIIMSIGQETLNNQRALALEELTSTHIELLQENEISQAIIDAYVDLDPEYGLTVPDPIPMNSAIKSTQSTLTWGQLLQIVEIVPSRMSPGLIQTLVSTARERITSLNRIYSNLPATFGVNTIPNTNAGLFQWLLVGRHSLLLAIAYHKFNYVKQKSALDLPKIGATYNAGSLVYKAGFGNGTAGQPYIPNPWIMKFNGIDYPRNTSRYYNAVKNNNTINPRAKFWRNIP